MNLFLKLLQSVPPPPPEVPRFKPKIYWWTPILIVALALLAIAILAWIVRALARRAEEKYWPDPERLRNYRDPEPRGGGEETSNASAREEGGGPRREVPP